MCALCVCVFFLGLTLVVLPCRTAKVRCWCRTTTWHGVSGLTAAQSAGGTRSCVHLQLCCLFHFSFDSRGSLTRINAAVTWVRTRGDCQAVVLHRDDWFVLRRFPPNRRLNSIQRSDWRHFVPQQKAARSVTSHATWRSPSSAKQV